jgi:hypothetical protein
MTSSLKDGAMNNDYGGNRASRRTGLAAITTAVAVLATLAACGGGVPSASTATASGVSAAHGHQQDASQLLKLARCMRAHGVPSFPDPSTSGGSVILGGTFNFGSPQFQKAERACKSLIPAGLFPPES